MEKVDDPNQIELAWFDESRDFLLKQKCPSCGGIVFCHRQVLPLDPKVYWTIACGRNHPCHCTNPVTDRNVAFSQWRMIKALVKP